MKVIAKGVLRQGYEPAFKWANKECMCQECGALVLLEPNDDVYMPVGYKTQVLTHCPTCRRIQWFRFRHLTRWQRFMLR